MKAKEVYDLIESKKDQMEFLATGFPSVDRDLDGGFMKKELIVIGGFTGMGKSCMAGQLFWNIAKQGFKSAYISLEISNEMVLSRLTGSLANLKPTLLTTKEQTNQELEAKRDSMAQILVYDDYLHMFDLIYELQEIERVVRDGHFEFVVIDFIQNIMTRGGDEYTRLSDVSLRLQRLAKETNCCILVLSQLSNSVGRDGVASKQIEYKGSGNIATVCDLGFVMERGELRSDYQAVTLNLKKNRRGPSEMYYHLGFKSPGGMIYEPQQD